ncbi:MAG: phosphatase PAP2 family protein [Gammaproteobacteria bacterium]|jgi:acid phosphatase (class A)|nr:phosphatase PAP2 family protein [Gammaproteobacteria bacterium]MDH3953111.1 phosphatase PAP2 family protein [Gammaproteobacteria bacterium]MDH4005752.1 phosphatase PAP2 family protein [Gammaproteobacteria bacterium]NCF60895.1 phosphatase PAP2 family protein [Gammaproteobacteria bacterium]
MNKTLVRFGLAALAVAFGGCAAMSEVQTEPVPGTSAVGDQVEEIMPGMLKGYLPMEEQLDSKVFVLSAPADHSAMQGMDTAWADKMQSLRGTARWDLAARDADLHFPAPADVFSCALGISITEEDTPALYMLLWRTMTDIGLAPYSAKNAYQRERPFMVRNETTCTPQDEEALRKDGSYPSGHTAIGWGWALILTELSPDRAEQLLSRGRQFGESRNVCNAHWYSDIVAGRLVGAAAVARLHASDEFLAALEAARADIDRARSKGMPPGLDCAAEAAALAQLR